MNEQETTTGPKVYVRVKAPNGIECGGVLLGATRPTPKRPSIITIGFPVKPAKFTATGQGLAASDGWSVLQADMPKIEEAIAVASRPNVPVHAATFSPDGMYRYTLLRRWGPGPLLVVVMLNPSVASDEKDDPTIRRCMNFAKREKLDGIFVVNLFARISTKPTELRKCDDPIGPENDKALGEAAAHVREGSRLLFAYGNSVAFKRLKIDATDAFVGRDKAVADFFLSRAPGAWIWCLGQTNDGFPRHPVRLAKDTMMERFAPSE